MPGLGPLPYDEAVTLNDFLPDLHSATCRLEAVEAAATVPGRRALVDVLAAQSVPRGPRALASLDRLAQPGTVAVVTGQQAGLFGGPLLTTYKLLSAVAVARALEAETGHAAVPVFWLQNEDHDFVEIAQTWVPGRIGLVPLTVPDVPDLARCSVAHRLLYEAIVPLLETLRAELGGFDGAAEVQALLERAYRPGRAISAAFAELVATLFEPWGVVLVDSREPGLAALAAPFHARALRATFTLSGGLLARSEALAAAGLTPQVHVRPGAPLAFFHPDGPEGPRYRLEPLASGRYALVGGPAATFTEAELLARLEAEPRSVSSSALLRPLIQDQLLPTAAYVGGPAERMYFAQLDPLYAWAGRAMPLVVPRARFSVLEERTVRLLDMLGLAADDVTTPRDVLRARLADRDVTGPTPEALTDALLSAFRTALAEHVPAIRTLDATLDGPLQKLDDAVQESVSRFTQKLARARLAQDTLQSDRLDRLLALLQPNGVPQERVHGLPYYLARYPRFLEVVLDAVEPYSGALRELRP